MKKTHTHVISWNTETQSIAMTSDLTISEYGNVCLAGRRTGSKSVLSPSALNQRHRCGRMFFSYSTSPSGLPAPRRCAHPAFTFLPSIHFCVLLFPSNLLHTSAYSNCNVTRISDVSQKDVTWLHNTTQHTRHSFVVFWVRQALSYPSASARSPTGYATYNIHFQYL